MQSRIKSNNFPEIFSHYSKIATSLENKRDYFKKKCYQDKFLSKYFFFINSVLNNNNNKFFSKISFFY